jgi:DNA-binding LacI/PurR family transcriptional regulator
MQTPFKYIDIANVIRDRIVQGDYTISSLPSGRKLAAELGVSYLTARRAIEHLVSSGDLSRTASGRLQLDAQPQQAVLNVAMLLQPNESLSEMRWYRALNQAVTQRGGTLRPCYYTHASDAVITDTLEAGFNVIIIIPPHNMSALLRDRLSRMADRVMTLFTDMTDLGITCIDGGGASAVGQLLDHLQSLGHRTVDCICTGREGPELMDRIHGWRDAIRQRDMQGQLLNWPHKDKLDAAGRTCALIEQLASKDQFTSTALFCTTPYVAMGATRAATNLGLTVGKDLSLCTFGSCEMASMLTPSITTVITGDEQTILTDALHWLLDEDSDRSARVIEPKTLSLFIGESTGALRPRSSREKHR